LRDHLPPEFVITFDRNTHNRMRVVLKPETWAVWLGRSARMLEANVAQPIESQVVGVDKAIYMKSVSGNDHLLAAGKTAVKNRVGTLFTGTVSV
jgi:hypothetical protein